MFRSTSKILLLVLLLSTSTAPAFAQWVGPRGGQARSRVVVAPNAAGGSTFRSQRRTIGPNGGRSARRIRVRTDGQGNARYHGVGVAVGPGDNEVVTNPAGHATSYPRRRWRDRW